MVKDGDFVEKDQPLIILEDTRAKASLNAALWTLRYAIAVERRLLADQDGTKEIDFTSPYLDAKDPDVKVLIESQKKQFLSVREYMSSSITRQEKQIEEFKNVIAGLKKSVESEKLKLEDAKETYDDMLKLYKKQLENKHSLNNQKTRMHDHESRIIEIKTNIVSNKQKIAQAESTIAALKDEHNVNVAKEYRENHERLLRGEEEYNQAKNTFDRTVIKAPRSGVIADSVYHTVGAAVHANAKLMDLIPQNDTLIVEARVQPQDIESIRVGIGAKIQLAAFKTRLVPRVEGKVTYVSADVAICRSKESARSTDANAILHRTSRNRSIRTCKD